MKKILKLSRDIFLKIFRMNVIILPIVCSLVFFNFYFVQSELSQVFLIFRHGNRTPINTFPTDIYQEKFWPRGFGVLTDIGIENSYNLGKNLYMIYKDFLKIESKEDLEKQIYVRSTDRNRTIETVRNVLDGFFHELKLNLTYEDITIHKKPVNNDSLLKPFYGDCKSLNEMAKVSKMTCFARLNSTKSKFLDMLSAKTGITMGSDSITYIYQTLSIELNNNLKLVDWADEKVLAILSKLSKFVFRWKFNKKDILYRKLIGGELQNLIFREMNKIITGRRAHKMYLFSGHDSTVASFLSSIGYKLKTVPSFNSVVAIELHKKEKFFVKLYYKDKSEKFDKIKFPYCSSVHCSYNKLLRAYRDTSVTSRKPYC